jgi:GNAT superfamily N-acetyltransferase
VDAELRLHQHLAHQLGQWPPRRGLDVVGSPHRTRPGWDGAVRAVWGVSTPDAAVVSVPPGVAKQAQALGSDLACLEDPAWGAALAELVGRPGAQAGTGVFRAVGPRGIPDLPDAGVWLSVDDPRVPRWLHPFAGPALVALDEGGAYGAGVGLKRHDDYGWEIAVATEPPMRGRGIARRLVAQAARAVLAEGHAVTYLHAPDNAASARVAEAAGFPVRGWRVIGLWGGD